MYLRLVLALLCLSLAPLSLAQSQGDALKLSRITPVGEDVPAGRQIVFTFDRAVVPVGKMERAASEIPIDIKPKLACEWRWLNTTSLACQLGDDTRLKPATRYQVTVKPGIKTENGQTLAKPVTHRFITQRPKFSYQSFRTWRSPGTPVLQVSFNQKVSRNSVLKHVYFKAKGQRYSIKIAKEDKNKANYGRRWLVEPRQILPKNSAASLHLEPGLQPGIGNQRSVEKREIKSLHTFPDFTFLGIKCTNNRNQEITFSPKQKQDVKRRCNPMNGVSLLFSSPVANATVEKGLKIKPPLSPDFSKHNPWKGLYEYSQLNSVHYKNQVYSFWLPELLQAHQPYSFRKQGAWVDKFHRPLKQNISLDFHTDHRPPNYHFEHRMSVLEQGVDSEVPITVTNLNKFDFNYQTLTRHEALTGQQLSLPVSKAEDVAYRIPLGVRKLLKGKSGVVTGYFQSNPQVYGNKKPQWFFAQVSPYHLHVKLGHHNTLVWVTDFATGKPVSDVDINVYKGMYKNLSTTPESMDRASTDKNGLAMLAGRKHLDPNLTLDTYNEDKPRLIVRAQKGEDMALLPLDYRHIQSLYQFTNDYNLYSDNRKQYGHIRAWGTTAQGIYRTGETVQFKFWFRDQDNTRFVPAPKTGYSLKVIDAMGNPVHEVKDLSLSDFGGYSGEFTLAKNASTGWYQFEVTASFFKNETWRPMKVLVSDFTPAPFKVSNSISGQRFELGQKATVETAASLHAGGPYANAHTRVSVVLQPKTFNPKTPISKGFQFDSGLGQFYPETIFETEAQGDDKGQHQTEFEVNGKKVIFGRLMVESTVRDERGKDVASRTYADYNGRDRYVGVRQDYWLLKANTESHIPLLVVDGEGKAATGTAINTLIEYRETKASKVKGAGNAYLTKYIHQWIKVADCQNQSSTEVVACAFTPEKAGRYRITATIKDSKDREHKTTYNQWVSGRGSVLWESGNNNKLDIEAEQESYAVGEKARYLIKNPFPGAQALITIERYGVIDSWVQPLNDSVEILEVPMKAEYLPGFYLSVMVFSPRQAKPLDAKLVDLGKPSYKMGYVKTMVIDPYKTLQVQITSDKPVYKPREQVTLDVQVDSKHQDHDKPIELAVAVLDESVFALLSSGLDYYDPYKGFYNFEYIDLQNYNFLDQLVGRQHFAKKGANPGGDGGSNLALRDLFKYVSYWNPSIITDAKGAAQVQFNVPDNLTGWRVLVMATNQSDYMGLGDYNFKVNKTLELRPVLPNQILQGDSFSAGFSLMNRSDEPRTVAVSIAAEQDGKVLGKQQQSIEVAPYKRQAFTLALSTDQPTPIQLTATAQNGDDSDALQVSLPVLKRRVAQTAATYGSIAGDKNTESISIAYPEAIHPDTGGLSLTLSPTVLGNLNDSFAYMRDYPYSCWEQTLSKGLAAHYYGNLKDWLPEDLNWKDYDTFPEEVLARAAEFQAPNGGMAFFIPTDDRVSPYLSAFTAISFAWLKQHDKAPSDTVVNKLQAYLQQLLKQDGFPDYYSRGMAATTRAATLYALSNAGNIQLADIKRYMPHMPYMSLFGKALFLRAAMQVDNSDSQRLKIFNSILSQSEQTGGQVRFNESLDDGYSRILATPMRDNCVVLSALIDYDSQAGNKNMDLISGLARSLSAARKRNSHWGNTQENLFCMQAMLDYAQAYETQEPNLQLEATLGDKAIGKGELIGRNAAPLVFDKPMSAADVGQKMPLAIQRQGQGRVYYQARLSYAEKAQKATAVNAGMQIQREYHVKRDKKWHKLDSPMQLQSGELVRVDLYLSLPSARDFVVVDDPVPGGLEPVNRDLATSSVVDANAAKSDYAGGAIWFMHNDWFEFGGRFWSFYHRELRHHAARFYADYLPAGNYHLSYVAQAIVPGEYQVMPTHTEQMYEPDVYGQSKPASLSVTASP